MMPEPRPPGRLRLRSLAAWSLGIGLAWLLLGHQYAGQPAVHLDLTAALPGAPLGTKEQLVATLEQVRDDAQEMLAFGGAMKQEFLEDRAALQDQVYIRALAVDFFISLLTTVDDWAERTLPEIEGWMEGPLTRREERPRPPDHGAATGADSTRAHRSHTLAPSHTAATAVVWVKKHRVKESRTPPCDPGPR
jgi:hypothetical protein